MLKLLFLIVALSFPSLAQVGTKSGNASAFRGIKLCAGTLVAGHVYRYNATLSCWEPQAFTSSSGLADSGANGVLKRTALGTTAPAVGDTDYQVPLTFTAPLTRAVNAIALTLRAVGGLATVGGELSIANCVSDGQIRKWTAAGGWACVTDGGVWGSITGTLSGQTDLSSALAGKDSVLTFNAPFGRTTNTITLVPCQENEVYKTVAGVWTCSAAGAAGGGDASTNTTVSTDSEVALFSGTGGKTFKRSNGISGLLKLTAGAASAAAAGTDYVIPSGNVATATAFAADPADCLVSGEFVKGINASGVPVCLAPAAAGGDASTNTAISVDGEAVLFSGTTGKQLRRSTLTGVIKQASGVESVVGGTATDCVLVNGTSGVCGAADGAQPAATFKGGPLSGGNATPTYRAIASTDLPATIDAKTFTNATMASILNTGTLTLPTSTDTLMGRNTVDTVTNKSISGGQITSFVAANQPSADGIYTRTSTGVVTARTITAGTGVSVIDGSGVAGNPTVSADTAVMLSRATHLAGTDLKCAGTGTAGAQTCVMSPTLTTYTTNMVVEYIPGTTNVTTQTLNIDGFGVRSILKHDGTALAAGDLTATRQYAIWYDGAAFRLPPTGAAGGSATDSLDFAIGGCNPNTSGGVLMWQIPSTNPATFTCSNNIAYLVFTNTGTPIAMRWFRFPQNWNGVAPSVKFSVYSGQASGSTNLKFDAEIACFPGGVGGNNFTSPTYNTAATTGAANAVTPNTNNDYTISSIPISATGCAANVFAQLRITRDNTVASNVAGDYWFLNATLNYGVQ